MLEQLTQWQGPRSWVCLRIEQTKSLVLELGRERRKLFCDLEAEETRRVLVTPIITLTHPLRGRSVNGGIVSVTQSRP